MKKVAGTLKIDQAQFRELESFTKFGGDIDPVTARVIDKGRKNERLLIQPQYRPMLVEEEVAVIYCGVKGLLQNVPMDKVAEFEKQFIQMLHAKHQADVLDLIKDGQLNDDIEAKIIDSGAFMEPLAERDIYFFGNGSAKCSEVITSENAYFIEGVVPSANYMGHLAEQKAKEKLLDVKQVAYYEPFYLKEFVAAPSHIKGLD